MTRSDLIDRLAAQQRHLSTEDVELAVKTLFEQMRDALVRAERIEIRGFGAFSLHDRKPRIGRNPLSGEPVAVPAKRCVHFRPGKALRDRVNAQWTAEANDTAHHS